jgi:hypothetical protein
VNSNRNNILDTAEHNQVIAHDAVQDNLEMARQLGIGLGQRRTP